MKHGIALLSVIIMAALLAGCNNFFHELVPPDGDRITSFKIPGQVRAEVISDDAVMITMEEGTSVRGLLPEITVSPRAKVLPITFNYLQTAFPGVDVLSAAVDLYKSDDPAAYIEDLVRNNKNFNIPALNIPIDFIAPVDVYVIAAQGNIRRYTVYVSVENETNPGGGTEWPRLLGMGFAKANNPCLQTDALCWIIEDSRTVNVTVRYMPDSGFSFALVPTFVIWGQRMELDGNELSSDSSVIQFNAEPGKQTGTLTLWLGGNSVSYTLNITFTEDLGANEPMLEGLRFAKYDNPELVIDALCNVYENSLTVSARAFYPVEMPYLSFALAPSFEILGERLEVDGAEIRSGDETSFIQFNKAFGAQNKTLTVWRNGKSKDYALTVTFEEDPDTVRSITDFRFVKQDNLSVAANAVASIVNTDNTGAITAQVFYSGSKPSSLIPRFVSPGTVSVSGAAQTSGISSQDFSSPLMYRVVSRNGQFVRTYTVNVEFVSLEDAAPRITSFRFSQNLNHALTTDSEGEIRDDTAFIIINAYYGGTFPPEQITPEFSAEGLVQVMGSVQVSAASPQDFSRPIRYTVVHPLNSLLKRDYWVYTTLVQDASSHAVITAFSFHPDDNPGLRDEISARIDQMTGKITVYAPIGSGLKERTMYARFTAAGQVNVSGAVQTSGASGQMFNNPIVYTVVSANGLNRRDYTVEARELTSTMYVNQNAAGSGDGTSWENAFRFLQTACEAAAQFPEDVPKEIWIAAGTYTPANIDGYFLLTPNTSYIGGFAGYETSKSQRNIAANTVTVSGNLGGGVYARRLFSAASELNGDLSFENLRMSGVRGQQGSGVGIHAPIGSSSEISITDCVFSDIETSGTGGAVYVRGGGARITDVEFSACNNGNALWLDCSGDTEIKRVNVADSSANAFYLGGNGNKTLETLTVIRGGSCLNVQNTTGYVRINSLVMRDLTGAGIAMNGANGVKYLSGISGRNINGSAISCSASSGAFTLTGSSAVKSTFDNTGIIDVSNDTGNVSVLNTEIKNSKGSSAVSVTANGNTVIDALTIDGVPNGRGIYISSNGKTDITSTIIKNCVTTEEGGGMFIDGTGGSANISYTTITGCKANQCGGGMYLVNSGNVSVSNTTIETVTLTVSPSYGGGIYRSDGSLTVENSKIYNISGNNNTCAGIYHNSSADLVVDVLELKNIPSHGIYNTGSGVKKFSNITAVTNIGGAHGVYSDTMTSGSFTLSDSTFNSCGVYVYCSASGAVPVSVTDTDIRNAKGPIGLYTSTGNAVVTLDRVTIDGVPNGTGIHATSENTIRVSNSTIKNCGNRGIYMDGTGNKEISSNMVSGNTTLNSGGGVYVVGGTFTMNSGTISGNTSLNSGGGVYVHGGTFTMNSGTISGNIAQTNSGGGVYVDGGTFIMRSGVVISGNSVILLNYNGNTFGGGVYISGGTFIMEGGTISSNSIIDNNGYGNSFGGGVAMHMGSTFYMNGGTISSNIIRNFDSYSYGGGVAILYSSSLFKTGGTIYGNDGTTNANTCRNTENALVGFGHSVYSQAGSVKYKNGNSLSTANLTYDYNNGSVIFNGAWDY